MADFVTSLELWSLLVAFIALGVSVWSHIRTSRQKARIVELEEEREEDRLQDRESARLKARFIRKEARDGKQGQYLRIENNGYSEARDVRLWVDGHDQKECRPLMSDTTEPFTLGPGAEIDYRFRPMSGAGGKWSRPYEITLQWTDNAAGENTWTTQLHH